MRINDHQLIHALDYGDAYAALNSPYVVMDESTGAELELTPEALARLAVAVRHFAITDPDLAHQLDAAEAGRCAAGLNVKGQHYRCDDRAPHVGFAHRSAAAQAVWG